MKLRPTANWEKEGEKLLSTIIQIQHEMGETKKLHKHRNEQAK